MKEIYVFDIDGCVLPQVFPNITDESRASEKVIKELLEKSKNVMLYDRFIEFYNQNCMDAHRVVFITGRQKLHFGKMTEEQLSPLKKERTIDIMYYPEDKEHVATEYFDWKVDKVQDVMKSCNPGKEFIFKIYDDIPEYFPRIRELAECQGVNVELTPIKGPDDWNIASK